jgi:hypothetical protein
MAASVWVGDPRGITHPLTNVTVRGRFYTHVFGADLPAAVWNSTMVGALRGVPVKNFAGAGAHVAADVMAAPPGGSHLPHTGKTRMPAPPAAHQRPPGKKHGKHG